MNVSDVNFAQVWRVFIWQQMYLSIENKSKCYKEIKYKIYEQTSATVKGMRLSAVLCH